VSVRFWVLLGSCYYCLLHGVNTMTAKLLFLAFCVIFLVNGYRGCTNPHRLDKVEYLQEDGEYITIDLKKCASYQGSKGRVFICPYGAVGSWTLEKTESRFVEK